MPLKSNFCLSGFCSNSNSKSNYEFVSYEPVDCVIKQKPIEANNFTKIMPKFHSTQIIEQKHRDNKATSTMLKRTSLVSTDFEPSLSQISDKTYDSSVSYEYTSSSNNSSSSSSSCNSSTDSEAYYEEDTLYVCCISYQAKLQGDLNLVFADRVKLIHMNDDFALVEHIVTRKCGYVPRFCISTMNQFLSQVKYLKRK